MPNVLDFLGQSVLSGISGNAAYDAIKLGYQTATHKSWEDLFLGAFEDAVEQLRPQLAQYVQDSEPALNRQALVNVLRRDLNVNLATTAQSELTNDQFAAHLAQAMVTASVLELPGHPLTQDNYAQLVRNTVQHARELFKHAVETNDEAFRHALLQETSITQATLGDVGTYLRDHFGIVLRQLDRMEATLNHIRDAVTAPPQAQMPSEADMLAAAQQRLFELPLDVIPDPAPPPCGSHLPQGFMRNDLFVGREADLLAIAKALKGGMTTVIEQSAAVTGMGGVGKTQLANEFVHRYGHFFAGGVFWLSFANADAVPAEVATCGSAEKLDMPPGFSSLPLDEQVQRVLQAWQSPIPRLLIFDNCEDETLLRQWRRPGGCRVLVTSRRAQWAPALGVQTLALGELKHMESVRLLCNYRPDLLMDDTDLRAIAHELGNLPLALHLAGSYLRLYQRTQTPAAYLQQLRSPDLLEHRSMTGWRLNQEVSPTKHEEHVVRTFAISYEQLKVDAPIDVLAHRLLARAAYFAPGEAIPYKLLLLTMELATDDEDAMHDTEDALARLVNLGLLEEQEAHGALRLHRLVAAFVRAVANDVEAQAAVEKILLYVATHLNSISEPRPFVILQSHLRAAIDLALHREDEQSADLCNALGYHLDMIGDYAGSQHYYEQALAIWREALGKIAPKTGRGWNNVGIALYRRGKYVQAQEYIQRALTIWGETLGEMDPEVARGWSNLGLVQEVQGEFLDAQHSIEQALKIWEHQPEKPHQEIAKNLGKLGAARYGVGDVAGARSLHEQALLIRREVLPPTHPDIAESLCNVGEVLLDEGDLLGAQAHFEQALFIFQLRFGEIHPHTATAFGSLGSVLLEQGRLQEAKHCYERALWIDESLYGRSHYKVAIDLSNLGSILLKQDDLTNAQLYAEQALVIAERQLGPNHPTTCTIRDNLASVSASPQSVEEQIDEIK